MILSRIVPAVVVVAGLAGAAGIVTELKPAPPTPAALTVRQVPVSGAVRACPPGSGGNGDRIAVFSASSLPHGHGTALVTAVPAAAGQTAAGQTAAGQTAGQTAIEKPSATLTTPGTLAVIAAPGTNARRQPQAWSVTANGAMAPGMAAELADAKGQATVSCASPGSDIWFVGPGQQSGVSQIQLHLMNVDVLAATVELTVITDAGPVQSGAYSGITVLPHQLVTETLSSATSGASVVAIEVRTTTGRVAAAVATSGRSGPVSWLPSSASPAVTQVIPGVPPSASPSGLLLVVPGNQNARVSLEAITTQGRYQPLGSQQIDLPGQSASFVQLPALGGGAVALVLSSNVPVTASALVPGTGVGVFTVPVPPVTEQAVIAGNVAGGGLNATLSLTAPVATGRVRVTETSDTGQSQSLTLTIPGGRTLNVPLTAPGRSRRPFSLVIKPLAGSGPVFAARFEAQGQNTTTSIVPAISALTTITLPPARGSYAAITP